MAASSICHSAPTAWLCAHHRQILPSKPLPSWRLLLAAPDPSRQGWPLGAARFPVTWDSKQGLKQRTRIRSLPGQNCTGWTYPPPAQLVNRAMRSLLMWKRLALCGCVLLSIVSSSAERVTELLLGVSIRGMREQVPQRLSAFPCPVCGHNGPCYTSQ